MKKAMFIIALPLMLIAAGCETSNVSNSNDTFNEEVCNQYFQLLNCVIDNDTNDTYTEDTRKTLKESIKAQKEEFFELDEDERVLKCEEGLSSFDSESAKEQLASIGC